jgi:hypothetical protein
MVEFGSSSIQGRGGENIRQTFAAKELLQIPLFEAA